MGLEVNDGPVAPAPRKKRGGTPSFAEQIKAHANKIEHVTDKAGRVLGVKKLTPVDMFDLTILLGENSMNQAALMQALNVASVVEIDGERVARPATLLQLKALMQRLDFHGIAAAQEALSRFTEEANEVGTEAAKN